MGLSSLFKKLLGSYGDDAARVIANNADDAARVIANQGDDALRLVSNYGDDAARLVDEYGDDVMTLAKNNYADLSPGSKRMFDAGLSPGHLDKAGRNVLPMANGDAFIDGKKFHYPYLDEFSSDQDWMKAVLMDKHIDPWRNSGVRDIIKRMPDTPSSAPNWWSMYPGNTPVLGDVVIPNEFIDGFHPVNSMSTVLPKRIDSAGLILQSPELPDASGKVFGLRPHKNTALGRWFAKNNPDYGWETYMNTYTDPWSGELIKEYLPF